jgi:hypothetical protein
MVQAAPELDNFIAIDQHAIKVYLGFFLFNIFLGLALIAASIFFPFALLLTLGGGFIATLSGFPLKEYLARRDRIAGVELIKEKWEALMRSSHPSQSELGRLQELLWKLYEKRAGG